MSNFFSKIGDFTKNLFDDTYPDWMEDISLGAKIFGKDYAQHLFNTSITSGVGGFGLDYEQGETAGESDPSKSGWGNMRSSMGSSAAILASIFGGAYLGSAGEGAGSGASGGFSATGGTAFEGGSTGTFSLAGEGSYGAYAGSAVNSGFGASSFSFSAGAPMMGGASGFTTGAGVAGSSWFDKMNEISQYMPDSGGKDDQPQMSPYKFETQEQIEKRNLEILNTIMKGGSGATSQDPKSSLPSLRLTL